MPDGQQDARASREGPLQRIPKGRVHAASQLENISYKRVTCWFYGGDGAPVEKLLRVDYDPHDEMATALPSALIALGLMAPSFIAPGDFVRVDHDLAQSCVSLRFEPCDPATLKDV